MKPFDLASFIGHPRANSFLESLPEKILERQVELYVFDMNLRALVIKSISIIEIALEREVGEKATRAVFETFGSLRRRIKTLAVSDQYRVSKNLGFANQRELHVSLTNLNSLRNRAAHHEPIWRRRLHFGVPKFRGLEPTLNGLNTTDRYSPAASLLTISKMLKYLPPLIDFDTELLGLIGSTPFDGQIIFQCMGFEVS